MHIFDILEALKAESGPGSKERKMKILHEHTENEDLKNFFYWCLEPSINYWQSKITKNNSSVNGTVPFQNAMSLILDKLVTRNITGNKAKKLLTDLYYNCTPKDANVLERIITGKPDVGFNISTVNEVWADLIYDPAYMRCKGYNPKMVENWDWENDVIISQIKADGMFSNIFLGNYKIRLETRSGESLDKVVEIFPEEMIKSLLSLEDYLWHVYKPVVHGELLCYKDGVLMERSKANGLINKVKQGGKLPKNVRIQFQIWDYIPEINFYNHIPYDLSYDKKFDHLLALKNSSVKIIEHKYVKSPVEAQKHFVECLQRGLEGTVLKNASKLIWKNHDSPNQLKLKNKFRFEMRVVGFTEGEGKYSDLFGSMLIESECGLLKSAISGMDDKTRKYINANRSTFIGSVVEIEANGLFKNDDGSFGVMHPRFKEQRLDRTEADTLERIIQQEIDSITGKKVVNE